MRLYDCDERCGLFSGPQAGVEKVTRWTGSVRLRLCGGRRFEVSHASIPRERVKCVVRRRACVTVEEKSEVDGSETWTLLHGADDEAASEGGG